MFIRFVFDELFSAPLKRKVRAHDFCGVDGKARPLRYVATVVNGLLARCVSPVDLRYSDHGPSLPPTDDGRHGCEGAVRRVAQSVSLTDLLDEARGVSVRPYLA